MKKLIDMSEECRIFDCDGPTCSHDEYCERCMCKKCSIAVGKCPGNKKKGGY